MVKYQLKYNLQNIILLLSILYFKRKILFAPKSNSICLEENQICPYPIWHICQTQEHQESTLYRCGITLTFKFTGGITFSLTFTFTVVSLSLSHSLGYHSHFQIYWGITFTLTFTFTGVSLSLSHFHIQWVSLSLSFLHLGVSPLIRPISFSCLRNNYGWCKWMAFIWGREAPPLDLI